MMICDRCGCEMGFDYYYLIIFPNYENYLDADKQIYLCPNCKKELDKYLTNSKKKQLGYRVTLDEYAPGGYKTMRAEDEKP